MQDRTFFKAVLRDIVLGKFNYNQCFDSFNKTSFSLQSVTEILQAALNINPELIIEDSQLMTLNQTRTRNDCTL